MAAAVYIGFLLSMICCEKGDLIFPSVLIFGQYLLLGLLHLSVLRGSCVSNGDDSYALTSRSRRFGSLRMPVLKFVTYITIVYWYFYCADPRYLYHLCM